MFPLELPITRVPLVVTFSSSAEEFSVLVTGTDKSVMTLAVTLLKTSRLVVTTDVDVIDFSVFICSVLVVSFPVVLVIVLLLDSFVLVVGLAVPSVMVLVAVDVDSPLAVVDDMVASFMVVVGCVVVSFEGGAPSSTLDLVTRP